MKFKRFIVFFFVYCSLFTSINLFSQSDLKGIVIDADNKEVLIGATIKWQEGKIGTIQKDKTGFNIKYVSNSKLIVSYVGHLNDTISVQSNKYIEIKLKQNPNTKTILVNGKAEESMISHSDIIKTENISIRGIQKAACCNLSESFETNPSVDVSFSDAITGAKQIEMLGLTGKYTQILTERVSNFSGLALPFGLNYIPGTWMSSIQISKGAGSVINGYESIAGQINVQYKKPSELNPPLLNLYASERERFEANIDYSFEASDVFTSTLFAHASTQQSKIDNNGDGFLDQPILTQFNLMNRWNFKGDGLEGQFGVQAIKEQREAGQMDYFNIDKIKYYGIKINTDRYEYFTKTGHVFKTDLYQSLALITNGFVHNQTGTYGLKYYNAKEMKFNANLMYESAITNESNKITIGANFLYNKLDETSPFYTQVRNEVVPGVYSELNVSLLDYLKAIAGLRYDKHNLYGDLVSRRVYLKYDLAEFTSLRLSEGRAYSVPNILADYSYLLVSNRAIFIEDKLGIEKATNYGIAFSHDSKIFDTPFGFHFEYYHTDFQNQLVLDMESNMSAFRFYNLKGVSFSNSYQFDLNFEPIKRFNINLAYRINDSWLTIGEKTLEKALMSLNKGLINLSYRTESDDWHFDYTLGYNGKGRLPDMSKSGITKYYDPFWIMNIQITKKFPTLDVYIGVENLTNFRQLNPIIDAKNPFGNNFDATMVWGPIIGRVAYLGIRLTII
ncbi:MAG: TonB-dependent receptor [Candidatus Kapabacteria bacterium]|nr:TonB-dependent receptor [Candidatus Kapabacteria bacterium]